MSSIIKVDQIQLADGSTPTAGDLGLNTTGSVLQVQSTKWASYDSTTATSLVATGRSVNITPSSTSSKILIMVSTGGFWSSNYQGYGYLSIYRNGSSISIGSQGVYALEAGGQTDSNYTRAIQFSLIDSPNSTSELTYELYAQTSSSTFFYSDERLESSIIAMEIAG
jgi:hypothetical protein